MNIPKGAQRGVLHETWSHEAKDVSECERQRLGTIGTLLPIHLSTNLKEGK